MCNLLWTLPLLLKDNSKINPVELPIELAVWSILLSLRIRTLQYRIMSPDWSSAVMEGH